MDIVQLWWLSLAIFSAVVVVVAVLLGLIVAAAKSIDRHAAGIWTAGKQIAGNTVSIWMLDPTNEHLERIRYDVHSMNGTVSSINEKLALIAGRKG